jgi:polyisoprenoid-binding protein YceI
MVVAKVRGHFNKWSGKLTLDTNNLPGSSVQIAIEAGSVDTRDAQRDGHLAAPDFLNAAEFPLIEFKSKRVEQLGEHLKVVGDLTIRGTTKEVTLDADYGGRAKDPWGGERTGFHATTKIDRRDFALSWNQVLETGGVLVGEAIEIAIDVEAKKAA